MKSNDIVHLTEAEVDLNRLCENYYKIQAAASVRVICIVKADAYGHGALHCSAALRECGADFFGTANLAEAVRLRRAGIGGDRRIRLAWNLHVNGSGREIAIHLA